MKVEKLLFIFFILIITANNALQSQPLPDEIKFVRQGVRRMIFDEGQSIHLAGIEPNKIVGLAAMYPARHYSEEHSQILISDGKLLIQSKQETQTGIWFGGFNPFATYSIDLASCTGEGEVGFEFSDASQKEKFFCQARIYRHLAHRSKTQHN